ncbi:MAG: PAS domain-containing protein [Mongoliitalea sp.]
MKKPNKPISEDRRLQTLQQYNILDTAAEQDFDFLTKIAAEICGTPIAFISLIDGERQWIKSKVGMDVSETPRDLSVCAHTILTPKEVFEIEDLSKDERFIGNPLLKNDDFELLYYVGVPLVSPNGEAIGTLCALDIIQKKITDKQKETLIGLARQVMNLLETRKQNQELKDYQARTEAWSTNTEAVSFTCYKDEVFNCIFVSQYIQELTGIPASEFIENPQVGLLSITHPEDLGAIKQKIDQQLTKKDTWDVTYRIKGQGDVIKWVLNRGRIRKLNNQDILDGILVDITEKIQTEQLYKTIFESSDSIVCIHDCQGNLLHFNPAAARSLSFQVEDKIPEKIQDFIFEEDLPYLSVYFDDLLAQQKINLNLRLKSNKRTSIYWSCQSSYLYEENGKKLFMINAWDISEQLKTERKLQESESLFKIIAETISDVLFIYDAKRNNYRFISPNTERVIGVEQSYFFQTNEFIKDYVCDEFKEACQTLKNSLDKSDGYDFEYMVSVNGKVKWLRESVHLVKGYQSDESIFAGRVTDVSDRKAEFQHLENTKVQLEEIGKLAMVGGWNFDVMNNHLQWTKITYEIHDCPLEYLPNVQDGIYFYKEGESREKITHAFQNLLKKGSSYDLELEIISAKGVNKWVRTIGKPIFKNGEVVSIIGVFQDITASKTNALELQKTKNQIESILSEVNDIIWSVSYPENKMIFSTPSVEQITGYSIEEYYENPEIWKSIIHPDDRGVIEEIFDSIEYNASYSKIYRIIDKNGNLKWVKNIGHIVYDEKKHPIRIDGKISDITADIEIHETMSSQLELQSLLMKIATEYINLDVKDSDFKINSSLELIGKYAEADRAYIFDYDWENNICTNTFEWCESGITSELPNLQEVPLEIVPRWVSTHKNKDFMYIDNLENLPDGDGVKSILEPQGIKSLIALPIFFEENIYGFVGFDYVKNVRTLSGNEISLLLLFAQILANLKNRTLLEQDLIEAKERAEKTSQYKSQFLANMSHEIRTPLNGVIGFTDLLLKTPLSHVQKQYAENANISGKSLLGIINDILDFSKIEAGKLDLEFIEYDINEIANSSVDIIKFQASQKLLELILNIQPDLPRIMVLDPIRLKQVIINLLSNAVKFTEEGEVELKVQFDRKTDQLGILYVEVRDTGIGISEEQQQKLFQAFSQADSSTTRKYGGSGLGLTISNLLVNKMGGNIELESYLGKGSIFKFEFEVPYKDLNTNEKVSLDLQKVLILDDNINNITVLEENLKFWGIPYVSTQDPYEALSILLSDPSIDLGIIDYHMPIMDGIEVIMNIRNELKIDKDSLKLILLHSSTDTELLRKFYKKFDISFGLLKPVKSDEFYSFLANIKNKLIIQEFQEKQEKTEIIYAPESSYNILIAEDIDMNLLLIKTLVLQQLPKARIFECKNGDIAFKTFKTQKIDLVFMDVQMPKMDGIEATKGIRAYEAKLSKKRTPIIALTAGALKEERENCLNAGMDEFLTKPVQSDILIKVIEKYLLNLDKDSSQNYPIQTSSPPIEELNSPLFEKQGLLALVSHDMTLYKNLLEASLDFDRQISLLLTAFESHDRIQIKSVAHGIKGSAQSMFFTRMHQLVRKIENQIDDLSEDKLTLFIQEVEKTWQQLRPIIEEEIKKY